jgi:hypothetical protein
MRAGVSWTTWPIKETLSVSYHNVLLEPGGLSSFASPPDLLPPSTRYVMTPEGSRQRLLPSRCSFNKHEILPLKQSSGSVHPQSSSSSSIFFVIFWE